MTESVVTIIMTVALLYTAVVLTAVRGNVLEASSLNNGSNNMENNHTECLQALQDTAVAAFNKKIWALKMLDSWGRPSPGNMLVDMWNMLGDYKECLSAEHPSGNFEAQYCLVTANLTLIDIETIFNETVLLKMGVEVSLFTFGICIPSKCNGTNFIRAIEQFGNTSYSIKNALPMKLTDSCYTKSSALEFEIMDYSFVSLTTIIVLFLIFGTIHDYRIRRFSNGTENSILMAFSLYKNGEEILKHDDSPTTCVHGLKSLSMIYILIGHGVLTISGGVSVNIVDAIKNSITLEYILMDTAINAVDTFFFMGAMLLVFTFLREIHFKGSYDFPTAFLKRYLRFTLPYGFLIFFLITIGRFVMPRPPKYTEYITQVQSPCIKNLLWTFLYIKNYVSQTKQYLVCMEHGWYLDVDMQLFILSPALLFPVLKWPKVALFIPLMCSLLATNLELYLGIKLDMGPNPVFARHASNELNTYYTHTRSGPWFLGIAFGFVLAKIHSSKTKIPKKIVVMGWVVCSILSMLSFTLLSAFDFNYTQPAAAIHLSYIQLVWSTALAWVITACTTGNGGIVNDILSWGPFHSLSRISFSIYLVHVLVSRYAQFNSLDAMYVNLHSITYFIIWSIVFSVASGLVLALCIEMPATKLTRLLFKNVSILPLPRKSKSDKIQWKREEIDKHDENEGNACKEEDDEVKHAMEDKREEESFDKTEDIEPDCNKHNDSLVTSEK